jgi:replicative DNA helicase
MTTTQPLPANLDAERTILGVILLDNDAIGQAQATLTLEDFSRESHRLIYRQMLALAGRGQAIDPITLQEELRRSGDLARIGGGAYIASLFDGVPRFSDVTNYLRLVKDAAKERRLILLGRALMSRAFDRELTLGEQLHMAERELAAINDDRSDNCWREIAGVAYDAITEAEARAESGRQVLDFSTGFRDLDYVTDGFERGTMVALGAAPKMGKTALALSMTQRMSEAEENRDKDGRPPVIGWFSMEMSAKQQAQRFLASIANVDARRLRTGNLTGDEWRRVAAASQQMAGWRVHFDDRAALSPRAMRDGARRLVREAGRLDILFVDYLQLGDGRDDQRKDSREREVARVSTGLLQIAKDFDCTVIALSQFNRELFSRKGNRPTLADFRDSGQIAQDAHIVIGLHREAVYNPDTPNQNIAELIILAQRNGPLCTVELVFLPQVLRFEDKWRQ